MSVYKKVFQYVPERRPAIFFSIFSSLLSSVILVYAYALLYFFLNDLLLEKGSHAYTLTLQMVLALTLAGLFYLFSGVF